jgi:hypothetical protein
MRDGDVPMRLFVGAAAQRQSTPAEAISGLSSTRRYDYFGVGATAGGEPVADIVVHVLDGVLIELELYKGHAVPVRPPAPEDLHDFEIFRPA